MDRVWKDMRRVEEKAKERFNEFVNREVVGLPAPLALAKMGSELLRCYVEIEILKRKLGEW